MSLLAFDAAVGDEGALALHVDEYAGISLLYRRNLKVQNRPFSRRFRSVGRGRGASVTTAPPKVGACFDRFDERERSGSDLTW